MKEIGGYIELDTYTLPRLHEEAVALNCGRNALAYLIEAKKIKKICLPFFLCDSVKKVCQKYGIHQRYYHITPEFKPIISSLEKDEWLYIVNFYGQVSNEYILELTKKYSHIILDQAQSYFTSPVEGIDTIYTCRKFLGVPDGAFLYTDSQIKREIPRDESFKRMNFILGRYERTASEFYEESYENNKFFENEPIKKMSRLTENLLHGLDYNHIKQTRTNNFRILRKRLSSINQISVSMIEGAYMYPLLIPDAVLIKKRLLEHKVYIPTLWPNVLEEVNRDWLEWNYAKNILPIPCDQRYDFNDMNYIISLIERGVEHE